MTSLLSEKLAVEIRAMCKVVPPSASGSITNSKHLFWSAEVGQTSRLHSMRPVPSDNGAGVKDLCLVLRLIRNIMQ